MSKSNWINLIFTLIGILIAFWNIRLKKELSAPIPFLRPDFERSGKGSKGLIPLIKIENIGNCPAEKIEVFMKLHDIDEDKIEEIKLNGDNTLAAGETGYYEAPNHLSLDKYIIQMKYESLSNKKFDTKWKEAKYKYPDPTHSTRFKFKKIYD